MPGIYGQSRYVINSQGIRGDAFSNEQTYFMDQIDSKEQLFSISLLSDPTGSLPFYKRTAIWRLGKKVKSVSLSLLVQDNTDLVQDGAGKIYITWREHRRNAATIRNTLPDLSSALDEYSRNINAIIDLAEKQSVRLIFVTQPSMWDSDLSEALTNLLWMGGIGDYQQKSGQDYYSVETLADGMQMYKQVLLEACQTRQVECIDLASILPKDTTVFYDDVHFNESGAKKVAKALAEYMLQQVPFKEYSEGNQER